MANTLTAGTSGTRRGYSDEGFGSLSPTSYPFGGLAQRVWTNSAAPDFINARFSDNFGSVPAALAGTSFQVDGVNYPLSGTPVWDDGDLFTVAQFSAPGFAFVDSVSYSTDIVIPGADTGAFNVITNFSVIAHSQVLSAGAADITLNAAVAADGQSTASGATAISASVNVAAEGYGLSAGAGSVSASLSVAGSGAAIAPAAGTISAGFALAAQGQGIAQGAAALSATVAVQAYAAMLAPAAGNISASVSLNGVSAALAPAAGAISAQVTVAGVAIRAVVTPADAERMISLVETGTRHLEL